MHSPARAFHRRSKGQSLVEFVLALPILLLILLAAGSMGIGTYQAHMASDAIRETGLRKMDMARSANAINAGTLAGYINGSPQQGTIRAGSFIDNVSISHVDPYTSIIVGTKRFQGPVSFIPSFNIRVGQIINRNLLENANNGATARPYGTPWVPGDIPAIPPWEGGAVASDPAAAPVSDPTAPTTTP